MSEKKAPTFGTPAAIVVGAIIIGLAVVFAFSNRSASTQQADNTNNRPTIEEAAKNIRINKNNLASCVEEAQYAETVDAHMQNAQAMEIKGTPHSIVVGPNDNRFAVSGALPTEFFEKIIEIMKEETPRSSTTFKTNDSRDVYEFVMAEGVLPTISDDMTSFLSLPDADTDHTRGSVDPVVTIVEFSDIDCPFCARLHTNLQEIIDNNNDVQWIYRHLPIASLHPEAYGKAVATECVYELSGQDNEVFWEYLDILIDAK